MGHKLTQAKQFSQLLPKTTPLLNSMLCAGQTLAHVPQFVQSSVILNLALPKYFVALPMLLVSKEFSM